MEYLQSKYHCSCPQEHRGFTSLDHANCDEHYGNPICTDCGEKIIFPYCAECRVKFADLKPQKRGVLSKKNRYGMKTACWKCDTFENTVFTFGRYRTPTCAPCLHSYLEEKFLKKKVYNDNIKKRQKKEEDKEEDDLSMDDLEKLVSEHEQQNDVSKADSMVINIDQSRDIISLSDNYSVIDENMVIELDSLSDDKEKREYNVKMPIPPNGCSQCGKRRCINLMMPRLRAI
jgi:hypothetical protein